MAALLCTGKAADFSWVRFSFFATTSQILRHLVLPQALSLRFHLVHEMLVRKGTRWALVRGRAQEGQRLEPRSVCLAPCGGGAERRTLFPRAPLLERRHYHPERCKQRRAMTAYRPTSHPPGNPRRQWVWARNRQPIPQDGGAAPPAPPPPPPRSPCVAARTRQALPPAGWPAPRTRQRVYEPRAARTRGTQASDRRRRG